MSVKNVSDLNVGKCTTMKTIRWESGKGVLDLTSKDYEELLYACVTNVGFSPIKVKYGQTVDTFVGKYDLYIDYNNQLFGSNTDNFDPNTWKYGDVVDETEIEIPGRETKTFTRVMSQPVSVWNYN